MGYSDTPLPEKDVQALEQPHRTQSRFANTSLSTS
jgi:hypothetical protein